MMKYTQLSNVFGSDDASNWSTGNNAIHAGDDLARDHATFSPFGTVCVLWNFGIRYFFPTQSAVDYYYYSPGDSMIFR